MSTDLVVLHAVRTLGYADAPRIADRLGLSVDEVTEQLLDDQAFGWVSWSSYGTEGGWSLTESGKAQGELLLAAELEAVGARAQVEAVHLDFLPLNHVVAQACTNWQLAELGIGPASVSLSATIDTLRVAADQLAGLEDRLIRHLKRFAGYHQRFAAALARADGEPAWINAIDRDSCHRVWFELHEDLIATLGLTR